LHSASRSGLFRVGGIDAIDLGGLEQQVGADLGGTQAAAVSVVKNGLPVPPPKMTTRPASSSRTAASRSNDSPTWPMLTAVWTCAGMPALTRASFNARAFITVASMPIESAVARSMPDRAPVAPRNRLPPPTTMPTCTPRATTSSICLTKPAMVSA
jgi:hypothetical protein